MNALEEKRNPPVRYVKKELLIPVNKTSRPIFNVIHKNKKQQIREREVKTNWDNNSQLSPHLYGLPPQPAGYLRYPNHDCF